jgi:hypothetical protein
LFISARAPFFPSAGTSLLPTWHESSNGADELAGLVGKLSHYRSGLRQFAAVRGLQQCAKVEQNFC